EEEEEEEEEERRAPGKVHSTAPSSRKAQTNYKQGRGAQAVYSSSEDEEDGGGKQHRKQKSAVQPPVPAVQDGGRLRRQPKLTEKAKENLAEKIEAEKRKKAATAVKDMRRTKARELPLPKDMGAHGYVPEATGNMGKEGKVAGKQGQKKPRRA
ncbi:hypothetical protein Agub_g9421, partial [Astrephomene gubernaculifera]